MRVVSFARVAIACACALLLGACIRWPGKIVNPDHVAIPEERAEEIQPTRSPYDRLSDAEREELGRVDLVVVDDAELSITSTCDRITIRADAFSSLMAEKGRRGSHGPWYPALAFIVAHEMGHWVLPHPKRGGLAVQERRADRFAYELNNAAGAPFPDASFLIDRPNGRAELAIAHYDQVFERLEAIHKQLELGTLEGQAAILAATAAAALREQEKEARRAVDRERLLRAELRLRFYFATLDQRLGLSWSERSGEDKRKDVEYVQELRASIAENRALVQTLLRGFEVAPAGESEDARRGRAAVVRRAQRVLTETDARLSDSDITIDD